MSLKTKFQVQGTGHICWQLYDQFGSLRLRSKQYLEKGRCALPQVVTASHGEGLLFQEIYKTAS